ncbi:MAG: AsnC family transcriptional regulator [Candidatus Bathyarchaeota archaeon]|nr:AsnC family transcriptional regulator [Candidatus Bathyarchaeota archaeon]
MESKAAFINVSPDNLNVVEKVCDYHPYTRYRIRCFGAVNGIFAIFALPFHTANMLKDLLEKLKDLEYIESYDLETPTSDFVTTETNYDHYVANEGWRFDWEKWEKTIEQAEPLDNESPPLSVLQRLDEKDMCILRLLSKNARTRNKDIAVATNVEPYHVSRRRKALEKMRVITGYRVLIGPQFLQITSPVVLKCNCSIETTRRIATAVNHLPFQSTLIQTLSGFILYTTMTSMDFPSLVTVLRKQCSSIEILWCDYRSSFRYWFYDKPFKDGRWMSNSNFMVESVLSRLQNDEEPSKTVLL